MDLLICLMCDAPICFRLSLTRCLEQPAQGYSPTNWRGFAEHFSVRVEQWMMGPEDVVRYWVELHPSCHRHTIAIVMEYAAAREHRRLQQEFTKYIDGT